jgi:phosphotransferase system enzyme I (PtsI)
VLAATTSDECAELARLACEQPDAESARAAVRERLHDLLDELAL